MVLSILLWRKSRASWAKQFTAWMWRTWNRQQLKEKGMKIATAESCTGGLVSKRITEIPGASDVFECGVCSYANRIKHELLGVSEQTLERYGAVSPQTAQQMAEGIRRLSGAEIGISVTGIAGPGGGTEEKPVGLVFLAAACENKVYVQKLLMENRIYWRQF